MVNSKDTPIWTNFWFQWISANAIGFTAATALVLLSALYGTIDLSNSLWGWVLTGAIVGTAQGYVLRQQTSWIQWQTWLKVSVIGFGIGAYVGLFVFIRPSVYDLFLDVWNAFMIVSFPAIAIGASAGTGIGIMQWRILRHQIGRTGWWWVLTNTVGWGVALLVGRGVNLWVQNSAGAILAGIVSGTIVGIVTAATLFWLFQSSPEVQVE